MQGQAQAKPEGSLQLRSIGSLLDESFFVPSYQRGYRWTEKQVRALLDDLEGFISGQPPRESYYCLQPVVVRRRVEGDWELIDGQQRLTTLYLLLGYLGDIARMLGKGNYTICYETRPGSAAYLKAPNEEESTQNIDYHHMWQAHQAIARWFGEQEGVRKLRMVEHLLQESGVGANVRVIWYELTPQQDPREVFIRLNVGRIPLSSAELIRALLLRAAGDADHGSHRRLRIAQEWDQLEKALRNPAYWSMLRNGAYEPPTRIEYLFDIFTELHASEEKQEADELATFLAFQKWLHDEKAEGSEGLYQAWLCFRTQTAQVLEEWFEDRELYHLVGALIAVAPKDGAEASRRLLVELLREREGRCRSEFDLYLRCRLWERFMGRANAKRPQDAEALEIAVQERLGELEYHESRSRGPLRTALLLFNVAGLLESRAQTQRFGFDSFKSNTWDIEHVRSTSEYVPRTLKQQQRWLEHALDFVDSGTARAKDPILAQSLETRIKEQLGQESVEKEAFEEIFLGVRTLSGEQEAREENNALSNLALLDMGTNRSYRNAIFPVKRQHIIKLDRDGVYVPPGTRNVFLKYYNPKAEQLLLWDDEDQKTYARAQRETLQRFFGPIVQVKEVVA